MNEKDDLLQKALKMSPTDRAEIIDQLIRSLDIPDKEIDELWKREVENRLEAFKKGEIKTITLQDVIKKYKTL